MFLLTAVCVVLAVVAGVLVVVLRDDDGGTERIRPTDLLSDRQLALIRTAVPDPACDTATQDPRPDDPSLAALDVMRVDGTCLSVTTEYLPAAQVPARREALSRDPAVVEAAVSPPMSPDSVDLSTQDDHRDNQWPLDVLGVPEGSTDLPWPDGTGVVVAVIDTGIDETHPDLAAAVIGRRHYAGEGAHDPDGHGTHVAGIIGARNGNGGITGVAPGVSILDVPVHLKDANTQGPTPSVGLVWAVNHGADVANMSLGGAYRDYDTPEYRGDLTLWAATIEYARAAQVVLVASGGNCGAPLAGVPDSPQCKTRNQRQVPQTFEGVVNVGAVDRERQVTQYSTKRDDIDLVAPGGKNKGPDFAPFNAGNVESDAPGGGFARIQGTSQAAPHVAAAAAIARFVRPDARADEIAAALTDSADMKKLYVLSRDKKGSGHGLLNIPGMIDRIRGGPPATPPPSGPASGAPTPTGPADDPAARTQAAYVSGDTLYAYDGTTSNPVRRVDPKSPVRWLTWSADHTLLVGADRQTLFSWAGPGTQVVEKPCDWCDDPYSRPALVDDAAVTDPSGGAATGDLVMRVSPDGTLTRYNAHTLDEIGSTPVAFPGGWAGNVTLHGSVGGKLLVDTSGGAHGLNVLWLVDPVSGQAGPSHEDVGPVLGDVGEAGVGDSGDVAVSADGTKVALASGYASCGTPDAIYVLAGGDLKEIAGPRPVPGLHVDELFFNGGSLFATMSSFTAAAPGRPCAKAAPAGLWQLNGTTWQRVDEKMTTGRPLEGRAGTMATGWLTVRATDARLEPATSTDLDEGDLGTVTSRVWATPPRTEVPVPPPR
ncbi:S8 family serine peptidase [Yinghuangia sp. ASG 101]|uniref:S8 family peptidase n=1 Tax=Yinghuangia sp. ASG 101 TaxID=2896848 RepID=UPI001E3DEF72|nr:S8 family serine peptidase [Yinghuangia sp. ASG 101]UGQ11540.1 S8 family serine peptidase [Yinghuangia sp. ASG 101]